MNNDNTTAEAFTPFEIIDELDKAAITLDYINDTLYTITGSLFNNYAKAPKGPKEESEQVILICRTMEQHESAFYVLSHFIQAEQQRIKSRVEMFFDMEKTRRSDRQ